MPAGRFSKAEVERFIDACRTKGLTIDKLSMALSPDGGVTFSVSKAVDAAKETLHHAEPRRLKNGG